MKEREPSPLAYEYPRPTPYFIHEYTPEFSDRVAEYPDALHITLQAVATRPMSRRSDHEPTAASHARTSSALDPTGFPQTTHSNHSLPCSQRGSGNVSSSSSATTTTTTTTSNDNHAALSRHLSSPTFVQPSHLIQVRLQTSLPASLKESLAQSTCSFKSPISSSSFTDDHVAIAAATSLTARANGSFTDRRTNTDDTNDISEHHNHGNSFKDVNGENEEEKEEEEVVCAPKVDENNADLSSSALENLLSTQRKLDSNHYNNVQILTPRSGHDDAAYGGLHLPTMPLPVGPWRNMPRHNSPLPSPQPCHLPYPARHSPEIWRSPFRPRPDHASSFRGGLSEGYIHDHSRKNTYDRSLDLVYLHQNQYHPLGSVTQQDWHVPLSMPASEVGGVNAASSAPPSTILSIPCSPGHQISPDVDPGPILGIHRPMRTQRHMFYDVPFYGIENVDISSSRHDLLMRAHSSAQEGFGTIEGRAWDTNTMTERREHIWSVAHEDEYGLEANSGAGGGGEGSRGEGPALLRGRHKRLRRWAPIQPLTINMSNSGSGSAGNDGRSQGSGSGDRSGGPFIQHHVSSSSSTRNQPSEDTAVGMTSFDPHPYQGHQQRLPLPQLQIQMEYQSPSRPKSQGTYAPDTFTESLQNPKWPAQPLRGRRRYTAMANRHWKSYLCLMVFVGMVVAVAVVVMHKGSSGDSQDSSEVTSAGSKRLGGRRRTVAIHTGIASNMDRTRAMATATKDRQLQPWQLRLLDQGTIHITHTGATTKSEPARASGSSPCEDVVFNATF